LKVAVEGGVVKYYRNSTLLYTSTVAPTYPLQVDASLNTVNAGVYNVVIVGARLTASPVNYVLQDVQGSTRAVMSGTSVVARHDFLPFGEEISVNTGLRTTGQGFGAADKVRQRYGLTERDDSTGLDHTWWRKYENRAGRWTSADPYRGSMSITNPQSFNRYAYVQNDPLNFVDPSGLDPIDIGQVGDVTIYAGADPISWGGDDPSNPIRIVLPPTDAPTGGDAGGGPQTTQSAQPADPCSPSLLVPLDPTARVTFGPRARDLFSPSFAASFNSAVKDLNALGIVPHIPSAYRTTADQVRMVSGGSGPRPAAAVGLSRHQSGNAVDISGSRSRMFGTIVRVMEAHGFTWGGHWKHRDPPHFELNPFGPRGSQAFRQAARAASNQAEQYFNQCFVHVP
jgi:RHS repeat-associated protein